VSEEVMEVMEVMKVIQVGADRVGLSRSPHRTTITDITCITSITSRLRRHG